MVGGICLAALLKNKEAPSEPSSVIQEVAIAPLQEKSAAPSPEASPALLVAVPEEKVNVDRVKQLFALDSSKLPIVETISYTSRVPWLKGKHAWVADYATHYAT